MRVVCISDTHELHRKITVPDGDLLIHAGDITWTGAPRAVNDFVDWFINQPHKHKIFIAGNHDFYFQTARGFNFTDFYLENQATKIEGLKVWGSPITPTFEDWAFMKDRGDMINAVWKKIPMDTDILITHGPPYGILDMIDGKSVGCYDLLVHSSLRVAPKLHVFGHIHGGYGIRKEENTTYVNASICDEDYKPVNAPIVVDLS